MRNGKNWASVALLKRIARMCSSSYAWHDDSPLVRVVLFLDRGEGERGRHTRSHVMWFSGGKRAASQCSSDCMGRWDELANQIRRGMATASARLTLLGVKLNLNLESIKVKKSTWALLIK